MINISYRMVAGVTSSTVYTATENGITTMLSLVNITGSDATVNVRRSGLLGSDIRLIAKDTVIKSGEAAYIDNRVLKTGQAIIVETTQDLDIDLNIT